MKRLLLLCLLLSISNLIFAQGYVETQKIIASYLGDQSQYGYDVEIQGDIAVVGANRGVLQGMTGISGGTVYILKKDTSGVWAEHQVLSAPDARNNDRFGISVDISGDYIVVGAFINGYDVNDTSFVSQAGAAYIFKKDANDNYNFEQKLVASDRSQNAYFGISVAMDGNRMIIGAGRESFDVNGQNQLSLAGAAYIFEKDTNGVWLEETKLVAPDRAINDRFGYAVDIIGDYVSIGAYLEDEDENNTNTISEAGSVYVYKRATNAIWNFQQKLVPMARPTTGERFARTLVMDANIILVGAFYSNSPGTRSGAAYVFKRDTNETWSQVDKLTAPDADEEEGFGFGIAIQGDRILVGAYEDKVNQSDNQDGALYYFLKDTNADTYTFVQKVTASTIDEAGDHNFGISVALDGDDAIVGDWISNEVDPDTNQVVSDAGAAFILNFDPNYLPILSTSSIGDTSVSVYPNPVQDYLNINFKEHYSEVKIAIYDMLGKLVLSKRYNSRRALSLPFHVEKGFYVVKIQSENNEVSTLKIVKQ